MHVYGDHIGSRRCRQLAGLCSLRASALAVGAVDRGEQQSDDLGGSPGPAAIHPTTVVDNRYSAHQLTSAGADAWPCSPKSMCTLTAGC